MAASFALGALVLSAGLAVMTYELARTYLLDQRRQSLVRQTYAAVSLVRNELLVPEPDILRVLSSLVGPAGTHAVLLHDGRWFAASLEIGRDDIPDDVRVRASTGAPVSQLFRVRSVPHLAVGVPLASEGSAFFEVASLNELDRTLRVLRNALGAAAAVTTLGGALVGTWAGRRLLRPLTNTAQAASEVRSGRLDVRLESTGDADLDKLTEAFNGMIAALEERVQRDARFASAVSHELRSPLTTLATSVEVVRARSDELPERARAALGLLDGDVRRFQRLVEDLLEMSRMGAGVEELSLATVRADEFAVQALRSAKAPNAPVKIDASARDLVIRLDKRRMERVFVNLVENAQTHGGGLVQVAVEAENGRVRFAVEDSGPGVPAVDRERIFEPFVRGRAAGRRGSGEGTGLGLALVAEHVRVHGGTVWVTDRSGGGARFVVELPVAP